MLITYLFRVIVELLSSKYQDYNESIITSISTHVKCIAWKAAACCRSSLSKTKRETLANTLRK